MSTQSPDHSDYEAQARRIAEIGQAASEAFARAADSLVLFADTVTALQKPVNRKLLAEVYGCPEDMVEDVLRVRMMDLKGED